MKMRKLILNSMLAGALVATLPACDKLEESNSGAKAGYQ